MKNLPWITIVWKIKNKEVQERTGELTVSPFHLIKTFQHYVNVQGHREQRVSFVAAKRIKVGDHVELVQNVTGQHEGIETQVFHANVISVDEQCSTNQKHKGLYAPVTVKGTLIVDNIISSQYSTLPRVPPHFDDIVHYTAHEMLKPLYKLIQTLHTLIPDSWNISVASGIETILFHLRIFSEMIIHSTNYKFFGFISNMK
jgi:hypothetical protein